MTVKLTSWALQQIAEKYDSQAKRDLALELVRGLADTVSRRLKRDEGYSRFACRDAAVSGRACLGSLSR